jgi:hypothetical protein
MAPRRERNGCREESSSSREETGGSISRDMVVARQQPVKKDGWQRMAQRRSFYRSDRRERDRGGRRGRGAVSGGNTAYAGVQGDTSKTNRMEANKKTVDAEDSGQPLAQSRVDGRGLRKKRCQIDIERCRQTHRYAHNNIRKSG